MEVGLRSGGVEKRNRRKGGRFGGLCRGWMKREGDDGKTKLKGDREAVKGVVAESGGAARAVGMGTVREAVVAGHG